MTISTKNEILDHLLSKKVEPDLRNIEEFSAHILSSELHISRSLASQYLNGFVKEGLLIKIATRPVYFLPEKTSRNNFRYSLKRVCFTALRIFWIRCLKKHVLSAIL